MNSFTYAVVTFSRRYLNVNLYDERLEIILPGIIINNVFYEASHSVLRLNEYKINEYNIKHIEKFTSYDELANKYEIFGDLEGEFCDLLSMLVVNG